MILNKAGIELTVFPAQDNKGMANVTQTNESPTGEKNSPPENPNDPPGPTRNIDLTLQKMNDNMMVMTDLLGKVCESLPAKGSGERETNSPPGRRGKKHRKRYYSSTSSSSESDHSPPPKIGRRHTDKGDTLSILASDEEIELLLNQQKATSSHTSEDKTATNENEDDVLKELEAALHDDEEKGPKLNQQVADIVDKRWGKKLPSEKINTVLKRHKQPENCANVTVQRVNPEIWAPLNAFKRKGDLRMANMQQALQKATFAMASNCATVVNLPDKIPHKKEMMANNIDAIALMGHVVAELSSLRREQLKPTLKAEYQAICAKSDTPSTLLFGDDLPKKIREAKEANQIASTVGTTKREDNYRAGSRGQRYGAWNNNKHGNPSRGYKQPFLGKGRRPNFRKKQYNNQRNEERK